MKVHNDYVDIEIGGKKYHLTNRITTEYYKRIIERQLVQQANNNIKSFRLRYCFLKFDTVLTAATPVISDFNIRIFFDDANEILGNSGTTTKYTYSDQTTCYDIQNSRELGRNGLQNYAGRKITAIGFGTSPTRLVASPETANMLAVVDTSNYNIYINEGESFLVVRQDTIMSDAKLITDYPSVIKSPVHLRYYGLQEIMSMDPSQNIDPGGSTYTLKNMANAYLESIGLGHNERRQLEIYNITKNREANILTILDPNSQYFELPPKGKYVLQPNRLVFPQNNLYMLNRSYSKIFFNYRIYQVYQTYNASTRELQNTNIIDKGYTYSMVAKTNQKEGKFMAEIYYESEG